ncbi:MAG TPA: hypothetical protein VET66_13950 [Steroidobacteraceae bacterium]|jgi:hypothetical protein|nr:hypothetical protein [Steroidobacteraceae bacterium]
MSDQTATAEEWVRFVRAESDLSAITRSERGYQQEVTCLLEDGRHVAHTFEHRRRRDLVQAVAEARQSMSAMEVQLRDGNPGMVRIDLGRLARQEVVQATMEVQ